MEGWRIGKQARRRPINTRRQRRTRTRRVDHSAAHPMSHEAIARFHVAGQRRMMHKSANRTRPDRDMAAERTGEPRPTRFRNGAPSCEAIAATTAANSPSPGSARTVATSTSTLWHSAACLALSARRCVRAPPLAPTCVAAAEVMLDPCWLGPCRQCVTAGSAASTPISSATSTGQPARGLPITMGGTQSPAAATPSRYALGVCQRAVQLNTRSPAMVPTYRQVRGTVTAVAAPACCVPDAHHRPSDAAGCAPPAGFR